MYFLTPTFIVYSIVSMVISRYLSFLATLTGSRDMRVAGVDDGISSPVVPACMPAYRTTVEETVGDHYCV